MKLFFQILALIFGLLTLLGAGFVLLSGGQQSAGFAVVPMVLCLAFLSLYRNMKD